MEQLQSVDLLLRRHIEAKDDRGLCRILRREGRKDPMLYQQVLGYFVQNSGPREPGEPPRTEEEEEER